MTPEVKYFSINISVLPQRRTIKIKPNALMRRQYDLMQHQDTHPVHYFKHQKASTLILLESPYT